MDCLEALAVLVRRALPAERELALGSDPRERRAELVRELGREPLLVAQAGGEALEQRVERGGQPRQLVVRLAAVEAAVEVVLAPAAASSVIRETGSSALPRIQWASSATLARSAMANADRADERDRRRLLYGSSGTPATTVPIRLPPCVTGSA